MPAILVTLTLAFGLGSCASYNDLTAGAFGEFQRGQFEAARASYDRPETTGSDFLQGAEAGMAALAGGDWPAAQARFHEAAEVVEELEDRSFADPEELGQRLLTWAINEGTLSYMGEGYERAALHAALAMTYLAQRDLDGVWVETHRANQVLEAEQKLYETEYAAGGIGHFMSAVSYELQGRYDDAYIDYERMAEKGVGLELAGSALVRIAGMLRYSDDLPRLIEAHGEPLPLPADAASIILIAGVGLGPFKREATLALPTGTGIYQWSVPQFERRPQSVPALELRVPGSTVRTTTVENVAAVARKNLDDRMAWLAAKSAVRGYFKKELSRNLEKEHGAAGWIAGTLFTVLTERADLRSWQTLPDTWQAARLFVAPGRYELTVAAVGGEQRVLGTYELDPDETMFVLARTVGPMVHAHPLGGLRVDTPEPVTEPVP